MAEKQSSKEIEEVSATASEIEESSEMTDETDTNMVNHMYEIFTNASGVNITEAILSVNESLEKTNKILYKILNVLSQHLAKS